MQQFMLPVLLVLCLIPGCIEVDMSAPSFPEMAHYFNVSEGTIELTLAYNFLGFWFSALVCGPLSECYGRRKVMIIGNTFLLIGAFGCPFVTTIHHLFFWRFVQGLGASTSAVIVFSMIADVYEGRKAIRLISIMNSALTFMMAISPIIGSFVTSLWGWQGNYFTVASISFISWVLLIKMLPETKRNFQKFNLKKILEDYQRLFCHREFICASLVPSLLYAAYMAFVACSPFLYMKSFNLSIFRYAYHQSLIIAVFSFVSLGGDYMLKILKKETCMMVGIIACLGSSIILNMFFLYGIISPFLVTSFMIIFCGGFALCYPIIFSASLEFFQEIKGIASSLIMALRALVCAGVMGLTSFLHNQQAFSIFYVLLFISFVVFMVTRYFLFDTIKKKI